MEKLTRYKVAAVQMETGPRVSDNLAEAARHIESAAAQGAKLVALPEFFALMGKTPQDALDIREADGDGPIQRFLSEQAGRHSVWLVGGTIPLRSEHPEKLRAASLLFDDRGERVARYDKIHLFDVTVNDAKRHYRESRTVTPGTEAVVVDTPLGRLGLTVCYDVRFPELFRQLATEGMDVLMLPSAFTAVTGAAHWETLLRARALENLCYLVAPAQQGYHANGRETYGDSMIVDPWGVVLARLATGHGIVIHDIDLDRVQAVRRDFPALEHMRVGFEPS